MARTVAGLFPAPCYNLRLAAIHDANGLSVVNVTLVKVVQNHLNTHTDYPGARIPGRNSEQQVCNDLGSL